MLRMVLPRVVLGLIGLLAVWAIVATGWLLFGNRTTPSEADTSLPVLGTKLVVLPFENLGPAAVDYFADGVTEEITSRLSEIPELGIISRTTALQYKGSTQSVRGIGEDLDVQYVLEGTVRWEGTPDGRSIVRVTLQLVRVADDIHIWTQRYDAILSEIFQVQSDIAEAVARALDITLLEPQRQALRAPPTESLEAYDFYLRGNDYYHRRFVEEDAWSAVEMYERAVELDPNFAVAYAALGRARVWLNSQFARSAELPRAREAVDEAVRLAPDLVEAHMALGDYHYYGRLDYEQALEQYTWVQRRQPSNSDASALIAWIQRRQGNWERSIVNAERALELDPRNTVWLVGQAQNHLYMGRYEQAESYFRRAIALAPDVPYYYRWAVWSFLAWDGTTERAHRLLQQAFFRIEPAELLTGSEASWIIVSVFGEDYAPALEQVDLEESGIDPGYYYLARARVSDQMGEGELARAYYDSARVEFEARVGDGPEHLAPHAEIGLAYAGLGQYEEAIREGRLAMQLRPVSRDAITGPDKVRDLARIYVMIGAYEQAIEQLEYLLSIPSGMSAALLRVDPFWDPLRSSPRFQMLLEADELEGQPGQLPRRITA